MFRLISAGLLASHREHLGWTRPSLNPIREAQQTESLGQTIRDVIPFFVAIQFSVYISGPFFAPFMLRTMGMDYAAFMFLIVLGYLGRVLTLHIASNLARSRGHGWLLMCGTIGIMPLSGLWWFYESFWFLAIMQLLGGVAWGCYELAVTLVFIERIPRHLRPRVLSVYGLCNGLAMVAGSLLGGVILSAFADPITGFMAVFIGSSILRGLSLVLFPHALFSAQSVVSAALPEALVPATPQPNGRPEMNSFANLSSQIENESTEQQAEHLRMERHLGSSDGVLKRSA
jgi:MFS family permease